MSGLLNFLLSIHLPQTLSTVRNVWATYLQIDHPWHDQSCHQEIRHCQAHNQVIRGCLKGFFPGHSHTHQYVAKHDNEDEEGEQHGIVVILRLLVCIGLVEWLAPVPVPDVTVVPGEVQGIHEGKCARSQLHPDAEKVLKKQSKIKNKMVTHVLPHSWSSPDPAPPSLSYVQMGSGLET